MGRTAHRVNLKGLHEPIYDEKEHVDWQSVGVQAFALGWDDPSDGCRSSSAAIEFETPVVVQVPDPRDRELRAQLVAAREPWFEHPLENPPLVLSQRTK